MAPTNLKLTGQVLTWLEVQNTSPIEAASNTNRFQEQDALHRHPLHYGDTLWVKLQLQQPQGSTTRWTLSLPQPFIDCVKFYQPDDTGGWSEQVAGDTRPQSEWTKKALHPDFDIQIPMGTAQDVYIRVRNFKHLSMPILIAPNGQRDVDRLREHIYLGLILGLMLALSLLSLIRYLEHRNQADAWACGYGLLITFTIAQINGVANALWWGKLPEVGDLASNFMPLVAMGATLLFVRHLYGLSARYRRYDRFLAGVGWSTLASALGFAVLDRPIADLVGSASCLLLPVPAWQPPC